MHSTSELFSRGCSWNRTQPQSNQQTKVKSQCLQVQYLHYFTRCTLSKAIAQSLHLTYSPSSQLLSSSRIVLKFWLLTSSLALGTSTTGITHTAWRHWLEVDTCQTHYLGHEQWTTNHFHREPPRALLLEKQASCPTTIVEKVLRHWW